MQTNDIITATRAEGIGGELNAIMRGYRGRVPAAKPREDKAAWRQHLKGKHLNRC